MGMYVNPGNAGFAEIVSSDYIDKTGLIGLVNRVLETTGKLICVSRPRRFGKSYAAKMLAAYYDCSCDSAGLFEGKAVSGMKDYRKYLNRFHVIYLDIAGFISHAQNEGASFRDIPGIIVRAVKEELREIASDVPADKSLEECLLYCADKPGGRKFVFIIDDWDAIIREAKEDAEAQKRYLYLLRGWFKNNNFTPKAVAAAYMTGILPIKKDGSQSAISDFQEFSILDPLEFAEYTGFTEREVKDLCVRRGMDFKEVKAWYDGYDFPKVGAVYNPYSVMNAVKYGKCRSYWRRTSAAESLRTYIRMDFKGLQEATLRLMAGESLTVDVDGFQNDVETFESADDVLTLLIHLGYLTYHEEEKTAKIPNEEIRLEFQQFLEAKNTGKKWTELIRRSQKLLEATIQGRANEVSAIIEEIREEQYAPQFYNNEQALRAAIKYAYIAAIENYVRIEEMPSGKGIADVVYIPKPLSCLPAMVIELKWNKSSGGAIKQIKEKRYTSALKPFAGNILLVGINYSERTGRHTCSVERA